jgi:hypothetical protein
VRSRKRSSSTAAISVGRIATGACRGELDRERDPVESPADLGDRLCARRDGEAGVGGRGPLHEEAYRIAAAMASSFGGLTRYGSDAKRHDLLALDAEPLAARREDAYGGCTARDRADELPHRVQLVLAVVDDEQHRLRAQVVDDALGDRTCRAVT